MDSSAQCSMNGRSRWYAWPDVRGAHPRRANSREGCGAEYSCIRFSVVLTVHFNCVFILTWTVSSAVQLLRFAVATMAARTHDKDITSHFWTCLYEFCFLMFEMWVR